MSFTNFNDVAKSKNQEVILTHVATGTTVAFPAFLTDYRDSYQVNWGNEKIFGRNDPIKPYQDTMRRLTIAFDVLSPNFTSAIENLEKFQTLARMMYPVYSAPLDGSGGSIGRTIKAPPLIRVKFVNMIQAAGASGGALLGCIEGVNFEPDKQMGYFVERSGELFPKKFNISFNFTPQHEAPLGWDAETSEFLTEEFPYSAGSVTTSVRNQGGANNRLNSANIDRLLKD
jgi:hypothetical protein